MMPMIWSVVADATPPEIAKAAFPPIFVVIQLGGILGALVAIKVSSLGGEVGLILLQVVFLLLVIAFTFLACHFNPPVSEASLSETEQAVEDTEHQPLVNGHVGQGLLTTTPARLDDRSWLGFGLKIFNKGMEGLWLLLSRPYVFMTFWVSYATLMPRTVLDYENQALVNDYFEDRDEKVAYLGRLNLAINLGVLVMALVGTRFIVERCGMRFSLTVLPVAMMMCVMGLCVHYGMQSSTVVVVVSSIIAYGLNSPCKEMLYVRTTREIKYKAKSWSEMYGNQVMKLFGAQINLWVNRRSPTCGSSCFHPKTTASVVAAWVSLWFGIAWTLGEEHARLEKEKKYVS
jgi:ATP/ADP translocase